MNKLQKNKSIFPLDSAEVLLPLDVKMIPKVVLLITSCACEAHNLYSAKAKR